jgi:hypothetical protein
MANVLFPAPVAINFGEPGETVLIGSVHEAAECLLSSKWPRTDGPIYEMATRAIRGASEGVVTPLEARRAFADAALEARVMVPRPAIF